MSYDGPMPSDKEIHSVRLNEQFISFFDDKGEWVNSYDVKLKDLQKIRASGDYYIDAVGPGSIEIRREQARHARLTTILKFIGDLTTKLTWPISIYIILVAVKWPIVLMWTANIIATLLTGV